MQGLAYTSHSRTDLHRPVGDMQARRASLGAERPRSMMSPGELEARPVSSSAG